MPEQGPLANPRRRADLSKELRVGDPLTHLAPTDRGDNGLENLRHDGRLIDKSELGHRATLQFHQPIGGDWHIWVGHWSPRI